MLNLIYVKLIEYKISILKKIYKYIFTYRIYKVYYYL